MAITTEFLLSSPSLPLVSITESIQTDQLECVHGLCFEQDARLFIVKVDSDDDVSEDELAALEEVSEATTLGRAGEQTVHRLTVELDDSISRAFDASDSAGAKLEPTIVTSEGGTNGKCTKTAMRSSTFGIAVRVWHLARPDLHRPRQFYIGRFSPFGSGGDQDIPSTTAN